jgi:hypothetical protein
VGTSRPEVKHPCYKRVHVSRSNPSIKTFALYEKRGSRFANAAYAAFAVWFMVSTVYQITKDALFTP